MEKIPYVCRIATALMLMPACAFPVEPEYWAGRNKDGNARNASMVSLEGNLKIRWARALTGFNNTTLHVRPNYVGQRGNGLAIRDGRILTLVPAVTNSLSLASSSAFATFGTFSLNSGEKLHETVTTHLGGGTRGSAALQDSDITYGLVNFYWNVNDVVFTGYGADVGRSYAFDAYSGTLPLGSPFSPVAQSPNGSGYFSMTYDNPRIYARGALNTHASFSKGRGGVLGLGETTINSMKHYAPFLVSGWDIFAFTMTNRTEDASFPSGLGTVITAYRLTNSPSYSIATRWETTYPSNTFAGFGLHHVRGAPRPLALGSDGRIYYYGFRNTMSGSMPVAADYASGMRLFAVSAANGSALFEINTGWNPSADTGLATSSWGTQLYHHFLPQIAVSSNHVVVFHPQVNQGFGTNLWTRGRLFCFDTANTSLLWSVTYTNNSFNAKLRVDDVVYNPSNNASPNSMWGDNTEQAVQMTVAGNSAYVVDPGIVGNAATGALQLTVYRYMLTNGSVTVTNLVPVDGNSNPITAVADRMVNANDNTNHVALRELAAVDGKLVALVDIDLNAQALVVIEGASTPVTEYAPVAAIKSPFSGIPPALQTFNDSRLRDAAYTNMVPVFNRAGHPFLQMYDTGTPVPFDASGSLDPDGGGLTYQWNFGDGQTESGSITSHVYESWGGIPAVSNVTVSLIVVDDESHTGSVSRVIQVRDVGNSTLTTLAAIADGHIYTSGGNAGGNYGASTNLEIRRIDNAGITQEIAYLKFDLAGVNVSNVNDAVLRVLVTAPKESFLLEAYAASNNWTEANLRGTNAPSAGDRLGDVRITQLDELSTWSRGFYQWVEFPVKTHVCNTAYGTERSFAIAATNAYTSALILASRSSTIIPDCAPKLILRLGSPAYAPPIITSTPPAYVVFTNSITQPLLVSASGTNLTYSWRQVRGTARAVITTNHSVVSGATSVSIPTGGVYVFCCLIDDGMQTTESGEITFQETPPPLATLSISVNNPAWGGVSPAGGTFVAGETVNLSAVASNYYHFVAWTGGVTGTSAVTSFIVATDITVSAVFAETLVTNSIPQWWLAQYGLATDDSGALSDTDGDGLTAWQEYVAGTLPNLGSSVLKLSNSRNTASGFEFMWLVVSGRVYSVYWTSNLISGVWSQLSENASGGYTDTVHALQNDSFYRIRVRLSM